MNVHVGMNGNSWQRLEAGHYLSPDGKFRTKRMNSTTWDLFKNDKHVGSFKSYAEAKDKAFWLLTEDESVTDDKVYAGDASICPYDTSEWFD